MIGLATGFYSPSALAEEVPLGGAEARLVQRTREEIHRILSGESDRFLAIVGPCSIHDYRAALDYATRLQKLATQCADALLIVMRAYTEKPRTVGGWKGFINDPDLDNTFDIAKGMREARRLLRDINALGLPCACEFLDPSVTPFLHDLVSWAAIGARTSSSQAHIDLVAGLDIPVGFKNATNGSWEQAVQAMRACGTPRPVLGIDADARLSLMHAPGNPFAHLVLRGGDNGPNYRREHIREARRAIEGNLRRAVIVDCSHGNSDKDYRRQPNVWDDVLTSYLAGEQGIAGAMLESFLLEGRQAIGPDMVYGRSVTDACLGWDSTEELLLQSVERLREARKARP